LKGVLAAVLQVRPFVSRKQIHDVPPQPSGRIYGFGTVAPKLTAPLQACASVHLPIVRLSNHPGQEAGDFRSLISRKLLDFDFEILRHQFTHEGRLA
jgi:hypothetical protein